jgi:hypothetical protein
VAAPAPCQEASHDPEDRPESRSDDDRPYDDLALGELEPQDLHARRRASELVSAHETSTGDVTAIEGKSEQLGGRGHDDRSDESEDPRAAVHAGGC